MDWKHNNIHRIVVLEARLRHVTSCELYLVHIIHVCMCMCILVPGMAQASIVHPGTVRGWPTAYIPTVRVSADFQVTLYIPGLSEDGQLHIYLLSEYPRISKLQCTCTSQDCARMANCIHVYTCYCQSIRGFPTYIVHPRTVRGWPTAYIPSVRVSTDYQVTLYILRLSEYGLLMLTV